MSIDNECEHGEYEDECGHCEAATLRAELAAEREAHQATARERDALAEAVRLIARGGQHTSEEFPDHPIHWPERFDCRRCDAFGADVDHLDRRHQPDCPVRIAREVLDLVKR